MLLLFGLPLGYYIYRFSSDLHGEAGGLLSLFVFAFCPNMIAFSGIANSDMAFCSMAFISCYCFWLFLKQETLKTAIITGLVTGLALATKLNAILILFLYAFIYAVHSWRLRRCSPVRVLLIMSIAVFVLFFSYGFDITPCLQGYQYRMMQLDSGFKTFFNGKYSLEGWWYFYPIVFLTKTPLPLLILASIALYYYLCKVRKRWFDAVYLFSPVFFLLLLFTTSKIAAGVRYLLPIYPFIFVSIGILAKYWAKLNKLVCLLAIWQVGSAFYIAPHYLSYFNEILGGPNNAYHYLVDSNLDWGQDLKGLKKYMDEHGIKKISLSYFGIDTPKRYGIDYDWLPSFYLVNPTPEKPPAATPENRFVAISVTNLQGVYLDDKETFAWFRQFEPVAKIGYSIFIYDLTKLPPAGR
jgi:4-amino-4-deoxy-L-arabinose transferase-like glycosyltransferase